MVAKLLATIMLLTGAVGAVAQESHARQPSIELSTELLGLLRAEMLEIAQGVQRIALSLAGGDWKSIHRTSAQIRDSYIMQQKLTPAQAEELAHALPARFKQLDAEFHRRAGKLGEAAHERDPELVAFHYARLLENCADCHAAFASHRFPGFVSPEPPVHHH